MNQSNNKNTEEVRTSVFFIDGDTQISNRIP